MPAGPPLTGPPLADADSLPERDPYRLPWPGHVETSGGVTLHVRETPGPDGVPAVYVHGLSGSATNWTDLAALLSTRAAGTAVDLPGFGLSQPLASRDYTPAGHADALMCFLAGRGRPVHLLGNSLGGLIALSVAARRPELVRTLTLVSPAMPDRRPDPRRVSDPRMLLAMVPRIGERARAELAAMSARDRAEQVIALCFGDPSCVPEHRLAETVAEIEAPGPAGVGPGGGEPDRAGHVRQLVPARAVDDGRPGAGADAGDLGRQGPAGRAPAGRAHRAGAGGPAADVARGGARGPDRGPGHGGPGGGRDVGRGGRRTLARAGKNEPVAGVARERSSEVDFEELASWRYRRSLSRPPS